MDRRERAYAAYLAVRAIEERPAGAGSRDWGAMSVTEDGWRKSTVTDMSSGNCVEVKDIGETVAIRDSKDRQGPHLSFTRAEWDAFLAGAKAGEFG